MMYLLVTEVRLRNTSNALYDIDACSDGLFKQQIYNSDIKSPI